MMWLSSWSPPAPAWCPMDEELLAQPQVMKLLDSLRERYTKYQELCRQRNKRAQLDEIHAKVMQVTDARLQRLRILSERSNVIWKRMECGFVFLGFRPVQQMKMCSWEFLLILFCVFSSISALSLHPSLVPSDLCDPLNPSCCPLL